MDSLEVEKLGDHDDSPFVYRVQDKVWYCQYFIPLIQKFREQHTSKNQPKTNFPTSTKLIEAYELYQKIFNAGTMIETYGYSWNHEYFKLDQDFYSKTLSSVKPHLLKYQEKLQIVSQIAGIVKYVSGEGVCIRTLRPQILGYTRQANKTYEVKLIWMDHGVMLQGDKNEAYRALEMKDYVDYEIYVAPEIRQKRQYSKKADVWSLGAIFFQLLFGSTYGIMLKHDSIQIQFPPHTPQWLKKILLCFLEEDPKKRCSIETCLEYLKPMRCCAETASKMMPQNIHF